jgi:MFS family permease
LLKLSDHLISAEGKNEWRAHWLVVAASIVGIMISQLHLYSLGVMIVPLEQEFGWGRAQISSGLLIISIVVFLLAPVMGIAIDRFGPRRIALWGVTFYSLNIALLSFAQQSMWMWWLLWLLVAVGYLFIKPTVWVAAIESLFSASRGLALAVTLSASGIVSSTGPLLTVFLVENFGWRSAYLLLGGLGATAGIPILFLFFSSARDKSRTQMKKSAAPEAHAAVNPSWRKAMLNPVLLKDVTSLPFIKLAAAGFIMSIASMALIVNLVPILTSSGISLTNAAAIMSFVGISQIIGRLSTGFLLDRFDARRIGALAASLPFVTCLILIAAEGSVPFAITAIVVFGLCIGAEMDVIAYLAARFFGTRNFGALFGAIVGILALGGGLGPILGGLVYDVTGAYLLALWAIVPLSLFSGYFLLTLGAYPELRNEAAETQERARAPASGATSSLPCH